MRPDKPPATPLSPRRRVNGLLVVVGIFGGILFCGVISAILFPVFFQARIAAKRSSGLTAIQTITTGLLIYATENDERYPLAQDWQDRVGARVKDPSLFQSPALSKPSPCDVAFRARLSGRPKMAEETETTVLLFDSTRQVRNASGNLDSLPKPGRWRKGCVDQNLVAFADGSARFSATNEVLL